MEGFGNKPKHCLFVRQRLAINNTCELVCGGDDGELLYLTSTGKNQFFAHRELFLGQIRNDQKPL